MRSRFIWIILLSSVVALGGSCDLFSRLLNKAPTVNIVSPQSGASVNGTVEIAAVADDDEGVKLVRFYINDALVMVDQESPWEFEWDTTQYQNGSYTLKAEAVDAHEAIAVDNDTILIVNNILADTVPPVVNITAPANGANVSGAIQITATASDNVGVTSVEFFIAGTSLGTDTSMPFSISLDTTGYTNGNYALSATAHDSAGNHATDNDTTVSISNAPTSALWDSVNWDSFNWN